MGVTPTKRPHCEYQSDCNWMTVFLFLRKYWQHWSKVESWAANHRGNTSNAMPVFLYGDEARYSATYGDKFIALVLGSPLVFKQRGLDWAMFTKFETHVNSQMILHMGFYQQFFAILCESQIVCKVRLQKTSSSALFSLPLRWEAMAWILVKTQSNPDRS